MKPKLNKRAKTLSNRGENSEPIHTDLITEILSRLPIKSVTRCRCVWKLWSSIVTLPHFTELFLTRSSSHPHLLFAYKEKNEFIFLSSPQPQNPDNNNKSSPVTVKLLSRIPFSGSSCFITGQVQGLFCLTVKHKGMLPVQIICNPSTGQALTLPEIKKIRFRRCYFGYDQINNQFKVLSINTQDPRHHVLTLGTLRLRWRRIKDCIRYDSCLGGVCIDGVLMKDVFRTLRDFVTKLGLALFEVLLILKKHVTFYFYYWFCILLWLIGWLYFRLLCDLFIDMLQDLFSTHSKAMVCFWLTYPIYSYLSC